MKINCTIALQEAGCDAQWAFNIALCEAGCDTQWAFIIALQEAIHSVAQ